MDSLNEIRNAFSKGCVMVDSDKIVVAYNDKDLTVYQELFNESFDVFKWLVKTCSRISINVKEHKIITMAFYIESGLTDAVLYNPLEKQIDLVAIGREINNSLEFGNDFKEFVSARNDVEQIDEEFLADMVRFMQRKHPSFETLDGYKKWKMLYDSSVGFLSLCRASDFNVMKYNQTFCGCIEITYYDEDCPVSYSASDKSAFVDALNASSQLSLVLDVDEGYIEMNLFP